MALVMGATALGVVMLELLEHATSFVAPGIYAEPCGFWHEEECLSHDFPR